MDICGLHLQNFCYRSVIANFYFVKTSSSSNTLSPCVAAYLEINWASLSQPISFFIKLVIQFKYKGNFFNRSYETELKDQELRLKTFFLLLY